MSTLQRYLNSEITADLREKMVFLGGPRQVGKTTFSQMFLPQSKEGYYNWDLAKDRQAILKGAWPLSQKIIVLDEIHKYVKWRSLVKGYFDTLKDNHSFFVTGSARLDYYRKSGDSLLGRYYYYRMHPLSLSEVGIEHFNELLLFGGFPEPFIKQSRTSLKRWHLQRQERILFSDIRDLERVNEITHLQLLMEALPQRVGSPLSRKNLSQELEVDFKTVERWLSILENVYYAFRILPFGNERIKAVKKEQKIYLWDWSEHTDEGKRWENFVASQLLKYCHYHQDVNGEKMELRFLRDINGREVDFVVIKNKKPLFAVECKSGNTSLSPHMSYFAHRVKIPKFYQVHQGSKSFAVSNDIYVVGFKEFSHTVGLV
jgi:uncharacterized protein